MSTVITATCSQCSQPADIAAESVLADLHGRTVSWICGVCGDVEEQPISASLLPRLVDAGISLISSRNAMPTGHPETPPAGDPLTLDDLLGLHEALGRTFWFQDLEGLVHGQEPADAS
jgi:hypothetical protein